jgi:N-acetylglucosaminyldiphosphoundecaprenol N-acetyl-beta-D-mannosaminyltransferase
MNNITQPISTLPEKRKVINTWVSTGKFDEVVEHILYLSQNKASSYVCFANVHMVMEAYKDKAFNQLLTEADIVSPDGKPLSIFMKIFDGVKQDRVPGMDVLPKLIQKANEQNLGVYFYGSTDEVLKDIEDKIRSDYPNVRIAGTLSPPFRALTAEEDEEIVQKINATNPDLLFVILGCPKQEKWMAAHKNRINTCMLGVGQAVLTFTGKEKRLPQWARNLSLEWTYRLWLEPKRLFKRYMITNTYFMWVVFGLFVKRKIFRMKG